MSRVTFVTNRFGQRFSVEETSDPHHVKLSTEGKEMLIPLDYDEFLRLHERWIQGAFIQSAFSMLNADQREFIMTGTTPTKWDEMFSEEE